MKFFRNFSVFFLILAVLIVVNCEAKKFKLDRKVAKKMISEKYQGPIALEVAVGELRDIVTFQTSWRGINSADLRWRDSQVKKRLPFLWLKTLADEGIISFTCSGPVVLKKLYKKRVEGMFGGKVTAYLANILYVIKINLTEGSKNWVIRRRKKNISIGLISGGVGWQQLTKEKVEGGYEVVYLKLCEKEITKITGIRELDKNNAMTEYEWKYNNFTPIGEIFIGNVENIPFSEMVGFVFVNVKTVGSLSKLELGKGTYTGKVKFTLYDNGWRIEN